MRQPGLGEGQQQFRVASAERGGLLVNVGLQARLGPGAQSLSTTVSLPLPHVSLGLACSQPDFARVGQLATQQPVGRQQSLPTAALKPYLRLGSVPGWDQTAKTHSTWIQSLMKLRSALSHHRRVQGDPVRGKGGSADREAASPGRRGPPRRARVRPRSVARLGFTGWGSFVC